MSSLRSYPSYKDSGVEWIGAIPSHWNSLPTKRVASRKKELNTGMKCNDRLSLTLKGVVPRALDDLEGLQASQFETYQLFEANDLVFKLIDLQNIQTSRVGIVPNAGIMSPAYIRLQPVFTKMLPKFGYWYFTSLYVQNIFNALGAGIRETLGVSDLLKLPISVPPISEQRIIAGYLDKETLRIDTLVSKKERFIELLKERRSALINHAVTKGLDKNAVMKDSGVEWIGNIPESWKVPALSYLFNNIGSGGTPKSTNPIFYGGGIPWVTTSELREVEILETKETVSKEALDKFTILRMYEPETLLIAMYGATVGRLGWLGIRACCNQACATFSKPVGITMRFAFYLLLAGREELIMRAAGGGQPNINQYILKSFRVPCPSLEEQQAITEYLDKQTAQIDTLIWQIEQSITLLKERRSALISAAVTGKIDLRGEA